MKNPEGLLKGLEPALVKFQPKIIGPKDHDVLKEWERLVTTRFGIKASSDGGTVSKTIDSCGAAGLDMTDTD